MSEPVGASTFFPANDEPTDKASFTIAVTVPQTYLGVANGTLKSIRAIGMKKRFVWDMPQQMTTWLATVHVSDKFRIIQARTPDGTPVRVYATPTTPAEEVRNHLAARLMFPYFERLIGRYPFATYGAVVVDDPALYYALETQSLSTFPHGEADDIAIDEAFVSPRARASMVRQFCSVEKWKDLWIAEGAATYFEILWPNRNDPAAFKTAMENDTTTTSSRTPRSAGRRHARGDVQRPGLCARRGCALRPAAEGRRPRVLPHPQDFPRLLSSAATLAPRTSSTSQCSSAMTGPCAPSCTPGSMRIRCRRCRRRDSVGAARTAARPDVVGLRCGPIRHRGVTCD